MSDTPVTPSLPPEVRAKRDRHDAWADAAQNIVFMGIASYAWLVAGKLDKYEALTAIGVVLGVLNVASFMDRFKQNRVPRAPLSAAVAMFAGGKGAAAASAAAEVTRRTLMLLPLCFMLGCGLFQNVRPRDINDIAKEFCELTMAAEAERRGITVKDLCLIPEILEPFLSAPTRAKMASVSEPFRNATQ